MTIKYKFILIFIIISILSCNTEPFRNPINVKISSEFNEENFKKSLVAVLPPESGEAEHKNTVRMILQAILKENFNDMKLIYPDETYRFIKQKKLEKKLEKVYAIYGDAEDNVLFAAALGIELKAKYTVYSKVRNVIYYGKKITDIERLARYNEKYHSTEEIINIRTRYFKKTIVTGYLKIVDNEKHRVVWEVSNFKTEIRKLSGFRSIPIDDVLNRTYGDDYYKIRPTYQNFPASARVIYRFFDRILSKW